MAPLPAIAALFGSPLCESGASVVMLVSMPVPDRRDLQEKIFHCRALSLRYVEGPANGPPLVLLHGITRDHSSFSALYPDLAARFHIFAVDLRGHGGSGRVQDGYRILDIAEDIAEFLSAIPTPAAIFGHSLGGMVGMCAAAGHAKVAAVIVGDSMITPSNLSTMYDAIFSQLHRLLLREPSLEELASGIGRIQIHFPGIPEVIHLDELPGNTSNNLVAWAHTVIRTDPECLRMTVDRSAYVGWNPEKILPRIACPVLLLQANPELDALLSEADLALAKRLLPRAECVRFPLLGHALFMQQPKPVLKAVMEFLNPGLKR